MVKKRMKEVPVCSECGSEDVSADAAVKWNMEAQDWEVSCVFDKGHMCENCGGECSIEFKEVK